MKKAYIKYIASLLLFGSNGIVASYIPLDSQSIVLLRTLIGSLFLITIFILSGRKFKCYKSKKEFGYLAASGAALGAGWIFLYEAYNRIGVSLATLAYYCGPVIVMVLAPVIFHEKLSKVKLYGLLSVLFGMFLVNSRVLLEGALSWGLICGILAAVMYAFMVIFSKKASGIEGMVNPMCQLTASFLTVGLYIIIKQKPDIAITDGSLVPILILGIVNTGIGCYLYFSAIQQLPAQSVVICGYLEPFSALFFSALLLKERMSVLQLIGAALILFGAAFGECYNPNLFRQLLKHKNALLANIIHNTRNKLKNGTV
ncbi:EamA family transporter [Anaerocolumna sp. AGMB13025]|uniref:DMT family transporter n=1 Tax=Anaerocolumna sp. AGMB13025 TaxID=3039116 RepID=UPI00241E3979|nr:EamA family transporter [Anaerocolumna sp. AGMB13025]WFR55671.1 EamA family transporter [Anaerocolumna sp. AGMB13025]